MADPDGVRGVQTKPKLFHFHGEFQEKIVKLHKSNNKSMSQAQLMSDQLEQVSSWRHHLYLKTVRVCDIDLQDTCLWQNHLTMNYGH